VRVVKPSVAGYGLGCKGDSGDRTIVTACSNLNAPYFKPTTLGWRGSVPPGCSAVFQTERPQDLRESVGLILGATAPRAW